MELCEFADLQSKGRTPTVFWFNPLAEGRIARGRSFTPVKHQAALVRDLENLPQFLCNRDDIVLVGRRPAARFLSRLKQTGFEPAEFVELAPAPAPPASALSHRPLGGLRPWAWGPDSAELFEPLFAQTAASQPPLARCYNAGIAGLYSKAWSAGFLRAFLAGRAPEPWLCPPDEAGVAARTMDAALAAIAAIRRRRHAKVAAKEAIGLAGHNAIRLWEPDLLDAQRRWLAGVIEEGGEVVIEPWLEREMDFSAQLEMETDGLKLRGYTGLINDRKGRYLGNWAAADFDRRLPAAVTRLFHEPADILDRLHATYSEIFPALEAELRQAGFLGPVGIDAFVYRPPHGPCRLKPIVEINPRFTMGRLTIELMRRICPGGHGLFRLVTLKQARAEGFEDFKACARSLAERFPPRLEAGPGGRLREGAVCLTDPARAEACLATFRVSRNLDELRAG